MLESLRNLIERQLIATSCLGCGGDRGPLCYMCRAATRGEPVRMKFGQLPLSAVTRYQPPISSLIIAFKDRGEWNLRTFLSNLLARAIADLLISTHNLDEISASKLLIVPIAATPASVRMRDADPVYELAASAAAIIGQRGLEVKTQRLLVMRPDHRDNVGLNQSERVSNMRDAFGIIQNSLPPAQVVIVDDVVTTGATIIAAAEAISKAGFRVIGAAAIAGPRLGRQMGETSLPCNTQSGRRGDTLGV